MTSEIEVLPWSWRVERARVRGLIDAFTTRWWQKYPRSKGVIGPSIEYMKDATTKAEPSPVPGEPDALGRLGHGVPGWQDRLGSILRMRIYTIIPRGGRPRRSWGLEHRTDRVPTVDQIMRIHRRHRVLGSPSGPMMPVFRRPDDAIDDRPLATDYRRDFALMLAVRRYYLRLGKMADIQQVALGEAARDLKPQCGRLTLIDMIEDYRVTASVGPALQSGAIEEYLRPWVVIGFGRPSKRI